MRAGRLRERVALQANTPTTNGYGERTESWATTATLWAEVENVGGGENESESTLGANATYTLTLRQNTNITTLKRFVWRGRNLSINAVKFDTQRKTTICDCAEEV